MNRHRAFKLIELPVARKGFTLIELLVVITIIVVLLALLTPALDRAIYQAELTSCQAGNLKGIASGLFSYAFDSQRAYPHRPNQRTGQGYKRANVVYTPGTPPGQNISDDREPLVDYVDLGLLTDPLIGNLDLEEVHPMSTGYANYELWYGVTFGGYKGMFRLGDKWESEDGTYNPGRKRTYSVLVSDEDKVLGASASHQSHPDMQNVAPLQVMHNEGGTGSPEVNGHYLSRYYANGRSRSSLDAQHAYTDGSVRRFVGVEWNDVEGDARMTRVPIDPPTLGTDWWCNVPKD